jgi:mono/diheme cytochrome c family protein
MVLLALFAILTMFEVFGREEKKFSIKRLKILHRINGIVYFLIFIVISYLCLNFIVTSKVELSPRGTLHSILALTILVLFGLKIAIIKIYRSYYPKVQTIGLLIALITFGMFGTSGGYYLLATNFGESEKSEQKKTGTEKVIQITPESIERGKNLFDSKCIFCHDAYSSRTIVGPGLKGVLKNPNLPVSKRPSTPENIEQQLKEPFDKMPSFEYLSEKEIRDIIAFLSTL